MRKWQTDVAIIKMGADGSTMNIWRCFYVHNLVRFFRNNETLSFYFSYQIYGISDEELQCSSLQDGVITRVATKDAA